MMPDNTTLAPPAVAAGKFEDPDRTLDGSARASVRLGGLATVWVNTGTLCNITCAHCYIESSPRNDRLAYFQGADLRRYLDEIALADLPVQEIGFTGGEPFMNPDIMAMIMLCLERGFRVLVLTNAMKPMMRWQKALRDAADQYGDRFAVRVSLDHYTEKRHESERGAGTWSATLAGIRWLAENGVAVKIAGRTCWDEDDGEARLGYARLLPALGLAVDTDDPAALVLFPEMREDRDVPEITEGCWSILGKSPDQIMCSNSRMLIKRKGAARCAVVACTLLPYDARFELGETLAEANKPVPLNHPYCAMFCVLGGGSCAAA